MGSLILFAKFNSFTSFNTIWNAYSNDSNAPLPATDRITTNLVQTFAFNKVTLVGDWLVQASYKQVATHRLGPIGFTEHR